MNNKNLLIVAAILGIGAYFYFQNKKTTATGGTGGGTSPGDDTTSPGGPGGGGITGGGGIDNPVDESPKSPDITEEPGFTPEPNAPNEPTPPVPNAPDAPITPPLTEIDVQMAACLNTGGTWVNDSYCQYSNSPNPRNSSVTTGAFDLDLGISEPRVNPKTGYPVNTGNTGFGNTSAGAGNGTRTPNYSVEFAALKNKIFA